MLGDSNTVVLYTVDIGALSSSAGKSYIVETLHHDAQDPHEECGDSKCRNNLRSGNECEHLRVVHEQLVDNKGYARPENHRVAHTLQVYKRGIAQDTGIGAEDAETDVVEDQEDDNRQGQQLHCVHRAHAAVEEQEYEKVGCKNNGVINQKYTPEWKCVPVEVPISYSI